MFDIIKHISAHEWKQEVLDSEKLVIVDFWASWCGPCRNMDPILAKISDKFSLKARIVKVNVDDEEQLASMNSIRSVPTFIFFKNAKRVDTLIGAVPESTITNLINKYAE